MIGLKSILFCLAFVALPHLLSAQIIINEILADPAPGLAGDANGDGVRSSNDDEFVELVNNSAADVDVSGWTLADGLKVRHTFPAGTVIAANCVLVLFGGGNPTGSFGGAVVQTAGTLSLNNGGDTVTLSDGATTIATYIYGSEGGDDQSITRDPDITGATLVRHSTATGSGGALFSPGTRIDGAAFSGCGGGALFGKITIGKTTFPAGGSGFSFTGALGNFTLGDGQSQTFGNLPAGDYSVSEIPLAGWNLDSVVAVAGSTSVISNGLTIHLQAGDDVRVTFYNSQPSHILINELDSDTPGSDRQEFIELFDGGAGGSSLDGLVLVLFNGSNSKSYRAIDLDGHATSGGGFFLVGNDSVPGIDLRIPDNSIQNGADAVALYYGDAADFPNGTPATSSRLIDAIVYGTDDPNASFLLSTLLHGGQPQVNENENGDKEHESMQRLPNGSGGARNTSTYAVFSPTPGRPNEIPRIPEISVDKNAFDFGDVVVGDERRIKIFVRNRGTAPLFVDSTGIAGPDSESWYISSGGAPFAIGVAGEQPVRLWFRPTSEGAKNATLRIRSNDPDPEDDPLLISLAGNGLAPNISASRQRLAFGRVDVGDISAQHFDLLNVGSASLTVDRITIGGSNASQYQLSNNAVPFSLQPGERRGYDVVFAPDTTGDLKGQVRFYSNDPRPERFTVSMSGEGRANPGAVPDISASPATLSLGLVEIGRRRTLAVHVQNDTVGILRISGIALSAPDTSEWRLLANPAPTRLAAGQGFDLPIRFQPKVDGRKQATLAISSNDPDEPELFVPLEALAVEPGPGSPYAGVLAINEIHYNPASSQGSDSHFEFLELHNTLDLPLDLDGFRFVAGIAHTFHAGDLIPANGFLVLAIDSTSYPGSLEWDSGNLVNSGELLKLVDFKGATVDSVRYQPDAPWPPEADGHGPSLELIDAGLDNALAESWQASSIFGGTPGSANSPGSAVSDLAVSPDKCDFGVLNPGAERTIALRLENQGVAPLLVEAVGFAEATHGDFSLGALDLPVSLAPGDTLRAPVKARPRAQGETAAALLISGSGMSKTLLEVPVRMLGNRPPTAPALLQPGPGEAAASLGWSAVSDPDSGQTIRFTVEIAEDANFSAGLQMLNNIADTTLSNETFASAFALTGGALYYWRVYAVDNYAARSGYSEVGSFEYLDTPTRVKTLPGQIPEEFALDQNFPNPFNPETQLGFHLPRSARVVIEIFNTRGQLLRRLGDRRYEAGSHQLTWDGRDSAGKPVASGVYVALMKADKFSQARKMTLLR